jgi:3-phenylpropionate/cinnamic acid dioxygenase small subunit
MNTVTKNTALRAERTSTEEGRIEYPVAIGSELYNRVLTFLYQEAWLLDHDLFDDWLLMLADDLVYTAPIRVTRSRASGERGITGRTGYHYYDTRDTIATRIQRILRTESAWSDDPPVRCRRFVSNVVVGETKTPGEYHVRSYLEVARNRFESANHQWITGERNDLMRDGDAGFQLARRSIVVDTSVLGTPNLAIFL